MNEHVLDEDKRRVIRLQASLVRSKKFFLAGGTGLGLRLGHRRSRDLDWFSPVRFDAARLEIDLRGLSEKPSELRRDGMHTLRAFYGELETSFLAYSQVEAKPEALKVAGTELPIADLEVIAAMKAAAVHDRGSKRDFIDIYAICKCPGWSVDRFIEHACGKLPLQPAQITRALTYYVDAEKERMPDGCAISWAAVKVDLTKGVRDWERRKEEDVGR